MSRMNEDTTKHCIDSSEDQMIHHNTTPQKRHLHNNPDNGNINNSNSNNNTNTKNCTTNNQYLQDKANVISNLLDEPMVDLWALRVHAITDGGLVNDTLRRRAWPKLVGLHERIWDFNHDNKKIEQSKIVSESFVVTPKRSNVVNSSNTTTSTATKENFQNTNDETTSKDNTTRTTSLRRSRRIANKGNTNNEDTISSSIEQQQQKVQAIFRSEVSSVVAPEVSSTSHSTSSIGNIVPISSDGGIIDYDMNSISSASASVSSSSTTMTLRHRNHQNYNKILASSLDSTQIELDVLRCTWHLLTKAQKRSQQQYLLSLGSSRNHNNNNNNNNYNNDMKNGTTTDGTNDQQPIQHNKRKLRKIAKMIQRKQRRLSNLINLTLVQSYTNHSGGGMIGIIDPTLRYYQGYHDVACIILSTIGISASYTRYVPPPRNNFELSSNYILHHNTTPTGFEMATSILYQLSQSHFRDNMRTNFQQLQIVMRLTIYPLLLYFDSEVHEHLIQCDMMEPYFALSWIITWFSHDIRDTELVKRLFDFFIVSHPLMPIYTTIAMICHPLNRQDVLQTEHDFSTVHQALSTLPRNSSMVGWKYRPGDGYVSDDDDDIDNDGYSSDDDEFDDDDLLSIGPMGSQSSVDTEFLLQEEAATLKHSNTTTIGNKGITTPNKGSSSTAATEYVADAEAVSIVSSSMSSMYTARVPFQELIDLAIQYIERIPPKNLILLATRYYGDEYIQKELFNHSTKVNTSSSNQSVRNDITFLQSPPNWTRSYTAHSDQTLKYYRSQQRRFRLNSDDDDTSSHISDTFNASSIPPRIEIELDDGSMYKVFQSSGDTDKLKAVIAAGYGVGDNILDRRRNRRRRKRYIQAGTTLAVLVIAIGVGYYIQQQKSRSKQQTTILATSDSSNNTSNRMKVATNTPFSVSPTSSSSTNNIIATSTKTKRLPIPSTVKITDIEPTNPRIYPFERKCPTKGLSIDTGTDGSTGNTHRRNKGNTLNMRRIKDGVLDVRTKSALFYEQTIRDLMVFGSHAKSISLMKGSAKKSKQLISNVRKSIVRVKNEFLVGVITLRDNVVRIPHQFTDVFFNLYHDNLSKVQSVITKKKQALAMKTSKVVNVAKSALIEFDNDEIVRRGTVTVATPTPAIIVTLRKQYEPSDLNIISDHLQVLFKNSIYFPILNLVYKFGTIRRLQFPPIIQLGEEQLNKVISNLITLHEHLLHLPDISQHHLSLVISFLNDKKQHINIFKEKSPRELFSNLRSNVLDFVQSKTFRDTIFGANTMGQYSSNNKGNEDSGDNSGKLLSVSTPDMNNRQVREANRKGHGVIDVALSEDRCVANLSVKKKKHIPFVMNVKAL